MLSDSCALIFLTFIFFFFFSTAFAVSISIVDLCLGFLQYFCWLYILPAAFYASVFVAFSALSLINSVLHSMIIYAPFVASFSAAFFVPFSANCVASLLLSLNLFCLFLCSFRDSCLFRDSFL